LEIFPAIDLRGGRAVRLTQGDFDRMEVYSGDPAGVAASFLRQGAKNLHVVDLDGAKDGTTENFDVIRDIARQGGLFIQVGGGIRTEERIVRYLELGVGRVILGTAAAENFDFLTRMVGRFGEKIAVGVDARDQKIAVRGWKEVTAIDSLEFCKKLDGAGVSAIIYTDIARDGAMQGTHMEVYRTLSGLIGCDVVASGGISAVGELAQLAQLGLYGAILGKSLYTGTIDLKEALSLC
jgi:phosphoribosylformimino-5-aminoimidazole carboxamide ribotide isomerase